MKRCCFAGVDEAGLGPRLGPLVIGATLFRSEPRRPSDLFRRLERAVTRDPDELPDRLAIDDSKRLYAGRKTLAPLELAALATLCPGGALPGRLEDLVERAGADRHADDGEWPAWYRAAHDEPGIPGDVSPALTAAWRARWPEELAACGLEHVASFVRPVLEIELNRSFRRGVNKSDTQLAILAPILRRIASLVPEDDLAIVVDRLGGRRHYAEFLCTVFPLRPLRSLREEELRSSYEIADGGRTITITFEVEGDGRHLPVALASVGAKYVRELFVRRLNAYFGARKPGLRPTAGYYEDANRWLADAADVLSDAERVMLVRER